MSRLDELIAELCPDGVEYRKIGDIANISRGKVMSKEFLKENAGEYPVYSSQTENDGKLGAITTYMFDGEYLTWTTDGANAGTVFYRSGKFSVTNVCGVIDNTSKDVDTKYLYYILNKEAPHYVNSGMGNPKLMSNVMARINLPVPPLEVQREIVSILDSFTLLTDELTTRIADELTARKKQYEFYRDKLLSHNGIYPMKPLAELGKWSGGKTPSMSEKSFWEQGTIPWISSKDMKSSTLEDTQDHITEKAVKEASMTVYPANSIAVVTRSGILKHTFPVAYVPFETTINQDIKMLVVNENILPRYAFHVIQGKGKDILVKTKKQGGTVDSLDFQKVLAYKVPVPSKDVQSKLVEVLDNFEAICTDLNIGLPAEIEARQKQYEYYRDLLLTFAETGSTLMTDRQTDRQTELSAIKLIQYVFGYVTLPMGSLFDFRNGLSKGKDFFGSGIPFIRYTDVYNNRFLKGEDITALVECTPEEIQKLGVHRGDVFFTRTSETAEDVGWSSVMLDDIGDCVFNGFTIKATPKTNYLLPEYCAFCFATEDFRKYVTSHCAFTTRASLTGKTIAEYQLAIPSIEKQWEIVKVLNKFHSICNDLSAGLPAEIEARQKQYEYYRDKLLSFKELPK